MKVRSQEPECLGGWDKDKDKCLAIRAVPGPLTDWRGSAQFQLSAVITVLSSQILQNPTTVPVSLVKVNNCPKKVVCIHQHQHLLSRRNIHPIRLRRISVPDPFQLPRPSSILRRQLS